MCCEQKIESVINLLRAQPWTPDMEEMFKQQIKQMRESCKSLSEPKGERTCTG